MASRLIWRWMLLFAVAHAAQFGPGTNIASETNVKDGTCPENSNNEECLPQDTLKGECLEDKDCNGVLKCCPQDCIFKCVEPVKTLTTTQPKCVVPVDLAFLIDASGSIPDEKFGVIQKFVKKVVDAFEVSESGTHVSAIWYSDDAQLAFNFNTLKGKNITKENVFKLIDGIRKTDGRTRIDKALRLAASDVFSVKGGERPEKPKILLVMTDGRQTREPDVSDAEGLHIASKPLKEHGVQVYSLGIGEDYLLGELLDIASDDASVFRAGKIDDLASIVTQITEQTCKGCTRNVDVHFAIDSSNKFSSQDFAFLKIILKAAVDKFVVSSRGTHFSISVFGDDAKMAFNFHEGSSKESVFDGIERLVHLQDGESNMDKAARLAATEAFSLEGGTRQGSPKVFVLLTAGNCASCKERLSDAVAPLENDGVKIITIAVGQKADKAELTQISSKPSEKSVFVVNSVNQLINSTLIQSISDAACDGHPGKCPEARRPPSCPSEIVYKCDSDVDCQDDEKCCFDPCGKACVKRNLGCLKPLDIAFAIDVSSRNSELDFSLFKEGVKNMISNFKIGASNSHVGMLTFSSTASTVFNFARTFSVEKMKRQVDSLVQDASTQSSLESAFKVAKEDLFSLKGRSRRGVPNVLVLVTKGPLQLKDAEKVLSAADQLKSALGGVEIVNVVIGPKIGSDNEVLKKASSVSDATGQSKFFQFETTSDFVKNSNLLKVSSFACSASFPSKCPVDKFASFCMQKDNQCDQDFDCPGFHKCCRDFCKRRRCVPEENVCTEKVDLLLILDDSSRVGEKNFLKVRNFAKRILPLFDVNFGGTRVAAMTYSERAKMAFDFDFIRGRTVKDVQETVESIPYSGGSTSRLDKALDLATTKLLLESRRRKNSSQAIILFTDGNTDVKSSRLDLASWPLRARKYRIVAVSVGDSINEKQLKNVVSLPLSDNVFLASNYDDVRKSINEITQMSCRAAQTIPEAPIKTVRGPAGDPGPKGDPGPTGPAGDKGPKGPLGDTGGRGDNGTPGSKGEPGLAGPPGPPGGITKGPDPLHSAVGILADASGVNPQFDYVPGADGPQGPPGKAGQVGDKGDRGPDGDAGAKGEIGRVGPYGPQGPRGKDGSDGLRGPVGEAGDKGLPGLQGPVGKPGRAGPQGPFGWKGERGASGASGDAGTKGAAGSKGYPGEKGAQGDVGDTGPSGAAGLAGPTGPQGSRGPRGKQGAPGRQGDGGPDGFAGSAGLPGQAGNKGPAGAAGDRGKKGPKGEPGLPGAEGARGAPGPVGAVGKEGASGPKGTAGAAGPNGAQGLTGPEGAQGPQGPQGLPGPEGLKGESGQRGARGSNGAKGDEGEPGLRGAPGPSGSDGAPGAPGAVGERGPSGPGGESGQRGRNGDPGRNGAQGIKGEPGEMGAVGSSGQKGSRGLPGRIGDQGAPGPAGQAGAPGMPGKDGKQGATGANGKDGSNGSPGAEGQQGFPGPVGPPGSVGDVGAQGKQGADGKAGRKGATGEPGAVGETGIQGPQGEPGAEGEAGLQGSPGVAGLQGPPGPTGPEGSAGKDGATGPKGSPGKDGPPGPQGERGLNGLQGPSGLQGRQGRPGDEGDQGDQGARGNRGADGPVGLQGAQGPPGPAGQRGAGGRRGAKGPSGARGAKGAAGSNGLPGSPGMQGIRGRQGSSGPRGVRGADGPSGAPGLDGIAGEPGQMGPPGLPGRNGGRGLPGPSGPPGDRGKKGGRGDQGEKGEAGRPGSVGPIGPIGAAGEKGRRGQIGDIGEIGELGPQGPIGPTGPPGATGPPGPPGPAGAQGKDGKRGPRGETGEPGERGPQGTEGDAGKDGKAGNPGKPGNAGASGGAGPRGPPGNRGPTGMTGAPGFAGKRGPIGAKGYRGLDGRDGSNGKKGPQGRTGPQGSAGPIGDPGTAGSDGVAGTDGLPGTDGRLGEKGNRGNPGRPGTTGDEGAQGPGGAKGKSGEKGYVGQPGERGQTGKKGETGESGATGGTGEGGARGNAGRKGLKGNQGATGIPGSPGDVGDKGTKGYQGVQGPPGLSGARGKIGADGPPGRQGPAGGQGLDGAKGNDGEYGDPGEHGAPGSPGPAGPAGPPGPPGEMMPMSAQLQGYLTVGGLQKGPIYGGYQQYGYNRYSSKLGSEEEKVVDKGVKYVNEYVQLLKHIEDTKSFSGTQQDPARSCKDLFMRHPKKASGDYWIDPNEGSSIDKVLVFCDKNTTETCIYPKQPKIEKDQWHTGGDRYKWVMQQLMEEVEGVLYAAEMRQMKVLKLFSTRARQVVKYFCKDSHAWSKPNGSKIRKTLKFLTDNENEVHGHSFNPEIMPTIINDGCKVKDGKWHESVFSFETKNLDLLPILDIAAHDIGDGNEKFGLEIGPVCFS